MTSIADCDSRASSLHQTAYHGSSTAIDHNNGFVPDQFCIDWNREVGLNRTMRPIDDWWTHHPDFFVSVTNDTHVCFERDIVSKRSQNLMKVYRHQFHKSCDRVHLREMWSSGWGADFRNVIGGLYMGMEKHHVPAVMFSKKGWHYTATKKGQLNPTCPEQMLTCYFLPAHPCGNNSAVMAKYYETNLTINDKPKRKGGIEYILGPDEPIGLYLYEYVTRPQLWLRRALYDYLQEYPIELTRGKCSVIHVRRADVALPRGNPRPYYAIADYVNQIPEEDRQHEVLLLTDDHNAVSEAHEFYPNISWRHIDRIRHNGTSGGWENQTPSGNPAQETIVILATFKMVQQCKLFVHGRSTFSKYMWSQMEAQDDHEVEQVDISVDPRVPVVRTKNEEELEKRLEDLAREMQLNRTS
eukprot:CAMPEP_0194033042 /NCGR_PEP_ID=MMETSP0009_2-20130614/5854_1 /TAXON_ID=210454 /ORGANISM="Grammatophora oceanica, Strain CCMP 410" /LENGTH=411 /DNA_ID=CAMNT_0038673649 /DNA_START=364 /DNA_END=1599 /DNA_ORIENTATION=+